MGDSMSIEEVLNMMDEAKRQLKRFKKTEILSARRKRRGLSQDIMNFKQTIGEFFDNNSDLLGKAYDSTKSTKRPGGQKSLKINLENFRVIITRMK
jgi:hypothetical protein